MCDDQASDLAKQLEECRRVVPQQIMEKLQEHLENVRPNAELTDDGGRENNAKVSVSATNPEDLKDKLSTTSQKMPEIRARIEEAVARTERVIRAIEYDASKSGEESNLERDWWAWAFVDYFNCMAGLGAKIAAGTG